MAGMKISPELKKIFAETVRENNRQIALVASGAAKIEDTNLSVTSDNRKRDENGKVIRNRPKTYRKVVLRTHQKYGDLTLTRKMPPKKGVKPSLRERWKVQCSCGNELIVPKYYLIRKGNPKTHCGCKDATLKSLNKREFLIYHMMHQRCLNPKHSSYAHYQRNGITIHPEWLKTNKDGFERWFAEVGPAPSKFHSLDRIDNRKGYIPGNLRWATAEQQRANQGDTIAGFTLDQIAEMGLTEEEFLEKVQNGEIDS